LQKAAGFFIEQVLLSPDGDSYRILGSDRSATLAELRRNMALIMRWLHPDLASDASSSSLLDRSLFASRITQAWETVKTDERRRAYNTSLAAKQSPPRLGKKARAPARTIEVTPRADGGKSNVTKLLVMQRVKSRGFWSRLRFLLGGGHE
jgi:DnaJ-class molecular chaperone